MAAATPPPSTAASTRRLHAERRRKKVCINQPDKGKPHGPVVENSGGRCAECVEYKLAADREKYAKRRAELGLPYKPAPQRRRKAGGS